MTHVLDVRSLHAYYGVVPALRGVSLRLEEGEAVGVGGPNGAGKSTLLKALLGLVSTRGEIAFQGKRIERWSTPRRIKHGIVYVPQERMVLGSLTVLENLRLFWLAGDRDISYGDATARALDTFPELARRQRAAATSLSGGERQMLALSRVLVTRAPRLVLLDEPSAGLAPLVIDRIIELLSGWRDEGLTYLLLEQNERVLGRCSERTLRLASGELQRNGSPSGDGK